MISGAFLLCVWCDEQDATGSAAARGRRERHSVGDAVRVRRAFVLLARGALEARAHALLAALSLFPRFSCLSLSFCMCARSLA
eukprot:3466919-Pleurochrysis_carterae.AAC.1